MELNIPLWAQYTLCYGLVIALSFASAYYLPKWLEKREKMRKEGIHRRFLERVRH